MKALISPNEVRETGYRVADVATQEFEIAEPLFWVDCPDDLVADAKWFDPADNSFKEFPPVEPVMLSQGNQPTVQGAQTL